MPKTDAKKTRKFQGKNIFNIALFMLSIGMLVYFCVADNNLITLLNSIPTLNLFWLIASILTILLVWFFDSRVIYHITNSVYPGEYKGKSAFKVTMVGQYFNSVTPFAVAGQPMQLLSLTRQGISSGVALSILIRKFFIYQTTLTVYSLAVIVFKFDFFQSQIHGFMPLALVGFASQAAVVVLVLLFSVSRKLTTKIINGIFWLLSKLHIIKKPEETSQKIQAQLQSYLDNNKAMNHNFGLTFKLYALTFLQLTALFIVPFLVYKAFHNPGMPVVDMISAQAFVTMISSYTPLPGGSGTSEGSFLVLFNLFFQRDTINQAMLLWRFITYYSCIIVGAFFAGLEKKKDKMGASESAAEPVQETMPQQAAVVPAHKHHPVS